MTEKHIPSPALGKFPVTGKLLLLLLLVALVSGCATPQRSALSSQPEPIRTWPAPPQPARITFLQTISFPQGLRNEHGWWHRLRDLIAGPKIVRMVRPYGLALTPDETLLIADTGGHVIHLYDLADRTYRSLPRREDGLVLLSPIDVTVDAEGKFYVSDSEAGKVYVFRKDQKLEGTLGQFHRPTGLIADRTSGRIYIVDTAVHKVRVYQSDGTHLFDFGHRGGGPGEFNYPTNICLGHDGKVYVTDSMNFRIQVFGPDGQYLFEVGKAGDGPGTFSKPRGVGVDSGGHIYVADATFDNIQILNAQGRALLFVGTSGSNIGQFYLPAGLFIDGKDRIFVADSFNRRVQVFQYLDDNTEASGLPDREEEETGTTPSRLERNRPLQP